jgi:8-oxo-dGTP diphosphatase
MSYEYEFPMAALAVDGLIFAMDGDELKVLVIRRGIEPFKGQWVFPGGHVDIGNEEKIEDAICREIKEETGFYTVPEHWVNFGAFADPGRDPRGRIVSFAHFTVINYPAEPIAGDDAAEAKWVSVADIINLKEALAFDHLKVLEVALNYLGTGLDVTRAGRFLNRAAFGTIASENQAKMRTEISKLNG